MNRPLEIGGDDRGFLRQKARPPAPTGSTSVRLVDLFSGCGGLTLGVLEACRHLGLGLDIRLAVEANPAIAELYKANFPPAIWGGASSVHDWFSSSATKQRRKKEVETKEAVGSVDILVGGPPCQGHSSLNNHTRGDDPKNGLYLAMVRAAEVLDPRYVLIENVPALVKDAGGVLDIAVRRLEKAGYSTSSAVVHLADIGVPQLRKRHILLASREGAVDVLQAVEGAELPEPRTLDWAIGDLKDLFSDKMVDRSGVLSQENERRARYLHDHGIYYLPNPERPKCHRTDHSYKSMYGRLKWNEPAQTITTGFGSPGQGRYLHPDKLRTLTPHEAARIQFFPDWFDFSKASTRATLAEAIGNAVPPKLGFVLAAYLMKPLSTSNSEPASRPRSKGSTENERCLSLAVG